MPLPNQQMNLVLSSDAKPRLKWTPELHLRFVDAINQLGGPESECKPLLPSLFLIKSLKSYICCDAEATPKSLMRIMAIHGLTLYHLKSHLQARFHCFCFHLICLVSEIYFAAEIQTGEKSTIPNLPPQQRRRYEFRQRGESKKQLNEEEVQCGRREDK